TASPPPCEPTGWCSSTRVGWSRTAATRSCSPSGAAMQPCSRSGRSTPGAASSRRRRDRRPVSTHGWSGGSVHGPRTPLKGGPTLACRQVLGRWRADLAKPPMPSSRRERIFLASSAVAIVVVAQLFDRGSGRDLLILVPAVVAFALPRLPAEVFAALV